MSSVIIAGNTSGTITLDAPNVAGTTTLTLPATTGTVLTSVSPASDLPSSIKGPAFGAYGPAGTTQALTSNVTAKVQINTENFDTNSNFDNTTNYRFTPTVAGYYQITGQVYFSGTGITQASARIYKNGSLIRTGTPVLCSSVTDIVALVSTVLYMNGSTDYIELYARGTFSGATAVSGAETDTYFQAFLARAA
jgi:hypothetical protein